MTQTGTVYLLGAGPGDPELITARALRRLKEADVVLYDALVHPDLLAHAAPTAECVFVGKRAGRPSERQARIQKRMLDAALAGKTVARLKGGDPFLFGRGSEEMEFLRDAGVPVEVVPGVPSPMAASAYAGITLTHRARSSSVTYLTATESVEKDRSSHDWARLATGSQTLVIFMGMRKLPTLMQLLIENGRSADTPAAVVQWASLPRQQTVVATVGTVAEKARDAGLGLPALTIVGDVVGLREAMRWYDRLPLFGKRVLVTRPAHQSEGFARMLRDQGAEAVCLPAIRILAPDDPSRLERAVRDARTYRWVVFTSTNGVSRFFGEVARQGQDARALGNARVAAIGPATRQALEAHGIRADVMPDEFRGESAADAVLADDPDIAGHKVLLPRAQVARMALPERLAAAGADVDVVPAYRTAFMLEADAGRLRDQLFAHQLDVLTFTSPSTVHSVAEALGEHEAVLHSGPTIACIGPITAAAATERGWPVHVTPQDYTAAGLTSALATRYRQESPA
ncbi:MAG: uroporphyrinogen-III C-methyltransferase [Sandaracinaceae bacterium]